MSKDLTTLNKEELAQALTDHRQKISPSRFIWYFDDVSFINDDKGQKFLVGTTSHFEGNVASVEREQTPHQASWSQTFAVLIKNNNLSNEAFEIEAQSLGKFQERFNGSYRCKTIKTKDGLRSEFPAQTDINITHYSRDGKRAIECRDIYAFYNVADRREIAKALSETTDYEHKSMATNDQNETKNVVTSENINETLLNICNSFIKPHKKDAEAAQEYRHFQNTQKFSAMRQAVEKVGGSKPNPRNKISKALIGKFAERIKKSM